MNKLMETDDFYITPVSLHTWRYEWKATFVCEPNPLLINESWLLIHHEKFHILIQEYEYLKMPRKSHAFVVLAIQEVRDIKGEFTTTLLQDVHTHRILPPDKPFCHERRQTTKPSTWML